MGTEPEMLVCKANSYLRGVKLSFKLCRKNKIPYNKIFIKLEHLVLTEKSNFSLDTLALLLLGQYSKASV